MLQRLKTLFQLVAVSTFGAIFLLLATEGLARVFLTSATLVDQLRAAPGMPHYYRIESDRRVRVVPRFGGNRVREIRELCKARPGQPKPFCLAVFGESAAAGLPYDSRGSFAGFLYPMLRTRYPDRNIIVFNFAFFAQTFSFARQAVHDALELSIDEIFLYGGHNELYPHNIANMLDEQKSVPGVRGWIKAFFEPYSYFLQYLSDRQLPDSTFQPTDFRRSVVPLLQRVAIDHYKEMARLIIADAAAAHVHVTYLTALRNLAGFSPFPRGETAELIDEAALEVIKELQESDPDLEYQAARYLQSVGNLEAAYHYYERASDHTARMGRAHSEIQEFIRNASALGSNVSVLDLEKEFAKRLGSPILPDNLFADWCHLTLETSYEIAEILAARLKEILDQRFAPTTVPLPSLSEIVLTPGFDYSGVIGRGEEEGCHLNVLIFRWAQARSWCRRALSHEASLRPQLGLGVAELELRNIVEARRIAQSIVKQFPEKEIQELINNQATAVRNLMNGLLSLAERNGESASQQPAAQT